MKNTIKYTESQEKEICQRYLNFESTRKICKEYGFTTPKLYHILKRNNIKLHGPSNLTETSKIDKIIELLKTGKLLYEACEIVGISTGSAYKYLKKREYKVKPGGQFERKYTLNETYFQKIDTFNKAQILGLILTDGTVSKLNKLVSIRLHKDDTEYLEKIRNEINSNKPIYFIEGRHFISPYTKKTYLAGDTASLDITSKIFYKDCINSGILPNKTYLNLGIPNENILPKALRKAFILGAFEGDGCITWNLKGQAFCFSIAGSENLCKDILRVIKEELDIEGKVHPHSTIFVVDYKRIKDIIRIYHWLYKDANLYMLRKRNKFEQLIEIFKQKGYDIN